MKIKQGGPTAEGHCPLTMKIVWVKEKPLLLLLLFLFTTLLLTFFYFSYADNGSALGLSKFWLLSKSYHPSGM